MLEPLNKVVDGFSFGESGVGVLGDMIVAKPPYEVAVSFKMRVIGRIYLESPEKVGTLAGLSEGRWLLLG